MSNSTTPDVSCPNGGDFYACGDGSRFVGCCGTNPCGLTGCSAGNLFATSFAAEQYGTPALPDQQCSAGSFYTCAYTEPPFWGCCTGSPCAGAGCPVEQIGAAFLSNNPATASPFLSLNETWTSADSTSDTSASPSTSASAAPIPEHPHAKSSNAGAIAGGVVGGLAVIAALAFGIFWLMRRRRRSNPDGGDNGGHRQLSQESPVQSPMPQPMSQAPMEMDAATPKWAAAYPSSPQTPFMTPPPTYGFADQPENPVTHEMPASEMGRYEMDGHHYSKTGIDKP